jgi:hypothetical protein
MWATMTLSIEVRASRWLLQVAPNKALLYET